MVHKRQQLWRDNQDYNTSESPIGGEEHRIVLEAICLVELSSPHIGVDGWTDTSLGFSELVCWQKENKAGFHAALSDLGSVGKKRKY